MFNNRTGLGGWVAIGLVSCWLGGTHAALAAAGPGLDRGVPPGLQKAAVESVSETPMDADNTFKRIKILKDTGKYPHVRLEESWMAGAQGGGPTLLGSRAFVADHLIVKMRPNAGLKELAGIHTRLGTKTRKALHTRNLYLVEVSPAANGDPESQIAQLNAQPGVLYAEPDYIVSIAQCHPNDPLYNSADVPPIPGGGDMWGLNNTGQTGGTGDADIDAPEAWCTATGSADVLVGVIDTGVDYNHPDLAGHIWNNPGETGLDENNQDKRTNGIDDDNNGYIDDYHGWDFCNDDNDPMDDHLHGTHCAGTIGAQGNNGIGVAGVCWDVSIVPLKFLGSSGNGSASDAIDAVTYATSMGVQLTSNSWGGGPYVQSLKDAIEEASVNGILFVAAAGNHGDLDNDRFPSYPASYDCSNIISVAATDHSDALASFSHYGATSVDLGAPGVAILSTTPLTQTDVMLSEGIPASYGTLSGTSMACPHVAGACALLKSAVPQMPSALIKEVLMQTVDPVSALSGKTISGGRLNVNNALQEALTAGRLYVPGDYPTIQAAINAASTGDTVVVDVGTYTGVGNRGLNFNGKAITVRAPAGPACTIIDCENASCGVYFGDGETAASVLDGFTIRRANTAVYCQGSSPTIRNCVLRESTTSTYGGGLFSVFGSPIVEDTDFIDNTATLDGGGLQQDGGSVTVTRCRFINNHAGSGGTVYGGGGLWTGAGSITNCEFSGNSGYYGGGLYVAGEGSAVTNCVIKSNTNLPATPYGGGGLVCGSDGVQITNCLIAGNSTDGVGGGVWFYYGGGNMVNCTVADNTAVGAGDGVYVEEASPTITNCILWDNPSDEVGVTGFGTPTITYSDINGGYVGMGNINADPQFLDAAGGNHRCPRTSPCVDAGDDSAVPPNVLVDLDGRSRWIDGNGDSITTVDMGAYEAPRTLRVPSQYSTIQAAIDAASSGDTILVADGTYTGAGNTQLLVTGKAATIVSESGAAATVIDCQGNGGGITFWDTAYYGGCSLIGFTITGVSEQHSGILAAYSSLRIQSCIVENNNSHGVFLWMYSVADISGCVIRNNQAKGGAGIHCGSGATATVTDSDIMYNVATDSTMYGGGGIDVFTGPLTVRNCRILGNSSGYLGGGIYCWSAALLSMENCLVAGNSAARAGGGVDAPAISATNCTIAYNVSSTAGGGLQATSSASLSNCIFWGNADSTGTGESAQIHEGGSAVEVNASHTCIQGLSAYSGNDNTGSDPLFRDPDGPDDDFATVEDNNLRLTLGSPCIDAGENSLVPEYLSVDLDGLLRMAGTCDGTQSIVDMGAYEFQDAPTIVSAESWRTHGSAGSFPIMLTRASGAATVECRVDSATGCDPKVVIIFDTCIQDTTVNPEMTVTATAVGGDAPTVGTLSVGGNVLTIPLTNATNRTCVTLSINNAKGIGGSVAPTYTQTLTYVLADVDNDHKCASGDLVLVMGHMSSEDVTSSTFKYDIDCTGVCDSSDRSLTQQNQNAFLTTTCDVP